MNQNIDYETLMEDLKYELDPIVYHLTILRANLENTKNIMTAIKIIKTINKSRDDNQYDYLWTKFPYNGDLLKSENELKDIISVRYPIEKFPEYWL